MIRRASTILTLTLLLAGLTAAPIAAQVDTGSADFSRYVAVGDSLTAAIVSAGWLDKFQVNSFPALLHRQATGGDAGFEQPLMGAPGVTPPLFLANLVPPVFASAPGLGQPTNLTLPRPYDNLGVPGATVGDALRTVTDGGMGPHDLVLRGQGTVLQQALALQPTFVTLFIGNNDALAAATSGTVIDGVTLTTAENFEDDYRALAAALAATGADLVVFTLPEVTAIPFVTTIPPVVVNPATNRPVLGPGGNPIPLLGPAGPLAADDRVLLTASPLLARGIGIPLAVGGTGQPLPGRVGLSAAETATITARIAAFNQSIRQVATEVGATLFDFNALFRQISADGVELAGVSYSGAFLSGGFYSYDGVHPTPFGYAFLANELVKFINSSFDADIPQVSLGPFVFGEFQLDPRAVVFGAAAAASRAQISEDGLDNLRFLGHVIPAVSAVGSDGPRGGNGGGDAGADGGEPAAGDDPPAARNGGRGRRTQQRDGGF